ncbi:MAG TPA: hypothetical protein VJX67_21220, partial [Blastocatellia bacterium]|nr:hypothetical protein [Blastocatellia bacterium]
LQVLDSGDALKPLNANTFKFGHSWILIEGRIMAISSQQLDCIQHPSISANASRRKKSSPVDAIQTPAGRSAKLPYAGAAPKRGLLDSSQRDT